MFKSFFPKPGPFFISAFIWSLLAVIFWQAGGGDWLLRLTGASQNVAISAARFWSLNYLVFLRLLPVLRRRFRPVLVYLVPAPLAVLVDPWHVADYLRHLVPGGSRGGD
ncbi:microcin B17 transporter [Raoultella terrigena]|uniref:Microcin B17 transporter n=1 Tax=Raoultella terrigena TaxID=577 RepID=A0A3P8M596_RAOTE|nr:microcin B17 transporter [Raoultella terrigena]